MVWSRRTGRTLSEAYCSRSDRGALLNRQPPLRIGPFQRYDSLRPSIYCAPVSDEKNRAALEREAKERYQEAAERLREGAYRFASKLRGQAGVIIEELVDPDGDAVATLADVEGEAGALALAMPIDMITFETWMFGQIGDQEELDLELSNHRDFWFNYGSWIGETMRRRHGGHWMILGDDPMDWRLGFSKIMLEVVPFVFAERLLRLTQSVAKNLISEVERIRMLHEEQHEKDGGKDIDRFTAGHYIRMHTMPLGQFMVMDMKLLERLWNRAAARDLVKEIKKAGKKLPAGNQAIVEKVVEALGQSDASKPISGQTGDRGLFEAIAQIVGLRRASAPVAMDVLENMVMPALHIGMPDKFPPLDDDDLGKLRKGIEMFAFFVDIVPHAFQADDDGFLKCMPHEELKTPYGDRSNLDLAKGDWVILNPSRLKEMLIQYDSKKLLARYDDFVKYVRSNPKAPRRRDDGRFLAETVARSLGDLRACVVAASKDDHTLMFRMLPPPG